MTNSSATRAATILLVDNEPAICSLITRALAKYGYEILQARDGTEAIVLAKEHGGPIHLLLTDVVMPGISGFDLADAVALSRPETKVLFMSGQVDDSPAVRHKSESRSFLAKPFTIGTLVRSVQAMLEPQQRRTHAGADEGKAATTGHPIGSEESRLGH